MIEITITAYNVIGIALALLVSYIASKILFVPVTYNGKLLPPISPASAIENFKNKITQKGLNRINHVNNQSKIMHARAMANIVDGGDDHKYGTAFRMSKIPLIDSSNLFIYVTDYKLARTILLGDKPRGIPEGIKKNNLNSFNIANRDIGNLFTTSSLDERREKARKIIAPAFSRYVI